MELVSDLQQSLLYINKGDNLPENRIFPYIFYTVLDQNLE